MSLAKSCISAGLLHCARRNMHLKCLARQLDATQVMIARNCSAEAHKNVPSEASQGISKAMQAYMERTKAQEKFIEEQIAQYEIGKRHLANMMGENPDTFTQEDIDNAIAYLLPSGLFDKKARPQMKHPHEIFPKSKEAQFDMSGKPFHSLFYTGNPVYYQLLQDVAVKASQLDRIVPMALAEEDRVKRFLVGSVWITKEKLEGMLLEKITDQMYDFFIRTMERYVAHPNLIYETEKEFIMKYRSLTKSDVQQEVPQLMYTDDGIPYMTSDGRRKNSRATVTVYGKGTGKFDINGQSLLYFHIVHDREQVIFPLQFTGLLGKVDVVATVKDGGTSGQSGAIRYGIANCLRSFVDEEMREKMRIAGLTTKDRRRRERKKPGMWGARRPFTWVAR